MEFLYRERIVLISGLSCYDYTSALYIVTSVKKIFPTEKSKLRLDLQKTLRVKVLQVLT